MRVRWVMPLLMVTLLAVASASASACIPGMPDQEFEAQAVSCGTAFLEPSQVTSTTVEELFPQAIAFKDRLYIAWQKEDFNVTVKYHLTVTSFDGTSWSEPIYLSSPDPTRPIRSKLNINPRLGASEDTLCMVWTSTETNWTTGTDDDLVFRYTEDGETWSEPIEVTGHHNTGLDKLPRVVSFDERFWFLWETNDQVDSDGGDMDIVMRSWDGHDLGQVIEVSPPGDGDSDHYVDVYADDEHMYVTWMKKNYTTGYSMHDVWARVFDGSDWVTPPMKLNGNEAAEQENPTVVSSGERAWFIWESHYTGKLGDPTSVIYREWTPDTGLSRPVTLSSLTSNGKDTKPTALWRNERLYVAWISTDQGVTFGDDPDLLYRVGEVDRAGELRFGDFVEVSSSTDDFGDQRPVLVEYDGILNAVWILDTNYTHLVSPEVAEQLGGVVRSPDVYIQSLEIPFEKRLSLVYALGTAFPTATVPTSAEVTVTDLREVPMEDLRVSLRVTRRGDPPSKAWNRLLEERGDGAYALEELEFPREGAYDVELVVDDVVAGSFVVDVVPPPPSFLDRVPVTALFFLLAGVLTGYVFYRMMGREDLVDEIRPAPLDRPRPVEDVA